jgi:hypothetical protein
VAVLGAHPLHALEELLGLVGRIPLCVDGGVDHHLAAVAADQLDAAGQVGKPQVGGSLDRKGLAHGAGLRRRR